MALPAVTNEQMAEVDRLMIEQYHIGLLQMMENAGRSLAEQARRTLGGGLRGRRIVVLCGAGNNGGGGMVAARHLHNRGAQVQARLAVDPDHLKQVPRQQWRILEKLRLTGAEPGDRGGAEATISNSPGLRPADLLIDALIGYGLRGDPRGAIADWIQRANRSERPILALDAPSGLDTTSGQPGSPCIRAAATLTLALPKTGLMEANARPYVGELFVADIGVPPELYAEIGIPAEAWFEEDSIVPVA